MGDVLCPIDGNKSTWRLVPEQSKCLSDKGQASDDINEQEDSHDEVEDKKGSAPSHCARIDVSSGQKKVDWGDDKGYHRDGQRGSSPKSFFYLGGVFEIPTDTMQATEDDAEQREGGYSQPAIVGCGRCVE